MGDRRVADRREPEKGVIRLKIKDLIMYLVLGIIIIALVITNIVLGVLFSNNKKQNDITTIEDQGSVELSQYDEHDAEDKTCELLITGDKSQINIGDKAIFKVEATNIESDSGIVMFEALLDYDSDSLECMIENNNELEWDRTGMIDNYITMMRKSLQPSSENQIIANISVKAKENASAGQATIKLRNIKFTTDDDNYFYVPDKEFVIDIVK